jgi:hypothetical protein
MSSPNSSTSFLPTAPCALGRLAAPSSRFTTLRAQVQSVSMPSSPCWPRYNNMLSRNDSTTQQCQLSQSMPSTQHAALPSGTWLAPAVASWAVAVPRHPVRQPQQLKDVKTNWVGAGPASDDPAICTLPVEGRHLVRNQEAHLPDLAHQPASSTLRDMQHTSACIPYFSCAPNDHD